MYHIFMNEKITTQKTNILVFKLITVNNRVQVITVTIYITLCEPNGTKCFLSYCLLCINSAVRYALYFK
jgi:hypothetical protein